MRLACMRTVNIGKTHNGSFVNAIYSNYHLLKNITSANHRYYLPNCKSMSAVFMSCVIRIIYCTALATCLFLSSCIHNPESSVKMADVTSMECFRDFAGKDVKISRHMYLMERQKGYVPDLRQLIDASTELSPLISKNAAWVKFTKIPKGTLVRVERILYSEVIDENITTRKNERANRMTAVVLLTHPATHQTVHAYYHMGSTRDACQSPSGATIWSRFKDLPWSAKISGSPFFAPDALDAQQTHTRLKEVPLGDDIYARSHKITSSRGFDGSECVRQHFVDILLSSNNPTIQVHIDGEYRNLRIRGESRDKLIKELQKIKAFENETIEAAPFDGFGYKQPLPHALKNLCSVWVSSPIGSSSISIFSIRDIMQYFVIE